MQTNADTASPRHSRDVWRHDLSERKWTSIARCAGFGEVTIALPREVWTTWGWSALLDLDDEVSVTMLGASPGERLMLVEGISSQDSLRRLAMASWRHNPTVDILWLCLLDGMLLTAYVDEDERGRARMNAMQIDAGDPRHGELDRWIELVSCDAERALAERARDIFRQETSTRRFFEGFQRSFELLEASMMHGPDSDQDRHDVALLVMLRLVVLYFLQARGALDGEKRYFARRLAAHARQEMKENFWSGTLKPLFFGALNRPKHARSAAAKSLGRMPFLNGGLFEPSKLERQHLDLDWEDEVWQHIIEGFFEDHRFVLAEPVAGDRTDAIDPEVLGKVFEGIMYGDKRHKSGSFYTPRELVTEMVERTILGHIESELSLEEGALAVWLDAIEQGSNVDLDVNLGALRHVLEDMTILDPAVGTGAFLMEALQLLRRLWGALDACGEEGLPADEYAGVREMIHRHLYGVDINVTAVRLCELRFWLALLGTLPRDLGSMIGKLEPLPNLGHRFTAGDSLVSALDLYTLRASPGEPGAFAGASSRASFSRRITKQRELQARHLISHGAAKQALRRQLEANEAELFDAMLDEREERLDASIQPLLSLSQSKDLFGQPRELSPSQRRALENLRRERDAVDAARRDSDQRAPGFDYELRFADVMVSGGFDIILTNPPWVRATRQDRVKKRVQQGRYVCGRSGLWRDAERCGVRATFGNQVDLAALFLERSLELLRPGGRMCALVPSKLLRALHGAGIRGVLARHTVLGIEDLSNATREFFDATTYPMILEVERGERERLSALSRREPRRLEATRRAPQPRFGLWSGDAVMRWRAPIESLLSVGEDAREPWMLVPPAFDDTLESLRALPDRLGELTALRPRRGVLTGCNDAFVLDEATSRELFSRTPEQQPEFTRPVLGGRNIEPWKLDAEQCILWLYDDDLELREDLPEELWRHLRSFQKSLEARSDHRPRQPWWRLYRVQPGIAGPKVVWRDLSMWMEAAPCMDGEIPLNTTYYIPCADPLRAWGLCALLNSTPARAFLWALAERARGGWRRHFAWVISSLPMPPRWFAWLGGSPDPELEASIARWRTIPGGIEQANIAIARDYGLSADALEDLHENLVFHVKHRGIGGSDGASDVAQEVAA